ncbi:MAG: helix-turn-helix domain-containing protein [Clostridiales Family XIII bacterium]|nr:helix-turn-helix domain-containing protein [Clostridiales Family XIII bacterium]
MENQIENVIRSFSAVSGIAVTFFDNDGNIVWECADACKFCGIFDIYRQAGSECRMNLSSSIKLASQISKPYLFTCLAGLMKIALPLNVGGKTQGCFIAGPFIAGSLREEIVENIFALNNIQGGIFVDIVRGLQQLKQFKPADIGHITDLFGKCLSGAIVSEQTTSDIEEQGESCVLSEFPQLAKYAGADMNHLRESESKLVQHVISGDIKKSVEVLRDYIHEVSKAGYGDSAYVKMKLAGVCGALFSRARGRNGVNAWDEDACVVLMDGLNRSSSVSETSLRAAMLVENIAHAYMCELYSIRSPFVRLVIQNIREHYGDKISLRGIAASIHTSPTYLSALFKQKTGMTFTEYLNRVRIAKSCEMLANTAAPLYDISERSGFDDQSYFSKVFKKIHGVTPREYRKAHSG